MGERRPRCQKDASVGGKGAVSAYKGAVVGKRALLVPEGLLRWRKGRRIYLKRRNHAQKGLFFVPEGRVC